MAWASMYAEQIMCVVTQHVKENERRLISKLNVPFTLCNGPCHTIFVSAILLRIVVLRLLSG